MENVVQKKMLMILGVAVVAGAVFFLRLFTWRLEVEHMVARSGGIGGAFNGIEEQWKTINASIGEARQEAKNLKAPPFGPSEVKDLKNMIESSKNN